MSGGRDVVPKTAGIDLGIEGLRKPILIGQGGFGAVYRAEQPSLGRTVAVKILSAPGMDERTRDRFARECVAIGALSGHPNIVTVFDSGINSWGRPFIVMDFMSRGSIADRVAIDGPLQWPEAVDMGVKVCGAVASAHAAGILHRDIKPQNVLVSAYGEPKLGDFGISSIGGEQTTSGTVTASLEHAAPELLDGAPASVATDVYALASTVYMMVSGQAPFARRADEPIQSVINRILTENAPDLRPRGVPGALCDVLERGLAKDPASRYASATEFANALRDVQEQQGLAATPILQTESVGGFEVLDRFAPGGTGTTGPTRARVRNEYVPPTPPPTPVPVWRRPAFIAAAVFVFLAMAAGAFALTTGRGDDNAPKETAVADAVDEPVETKEEPKNERPDATENDEKKRQKNKSGGNVPGSAGDGGSGAAVPPPLPPSSGGSSGAGGPAPGTAPGDGSAGTSERDGGSGGGGGGGTGGGGGETKEQQPQNPPPPRVWLYHCWNGKEHVATINREAYPGWNYAAEGLVYHYQEKGTKPITTVDGTFYIFAEPYGDTEPDVSREDLWEVSKGTERFYTSSQTTRANYVNNWDWSSSDTLGYVGK